MFLMTPEPTPQQQKANSRGRRYIVPLVVFLLMAVFLGIGLTMDPRRIPSPLIDKPVPSFVAPDLHDIDVMVSQEALKGQVSVVNVWASWCAACYEEHPVLLKLAQLRDTPIYGLNYKDAREDALGWLDRLGDPYTTSIFDNSGRVGIDWGVYGVPETFVVDHKGFIRHKHIGPINEAQLHDRILPILDKLQADSAL
jgi:cytochrome c biogenesis protein CcmG/thiol:disulfide interchange protein DsbE